MTKVRYIICEKCGSKIFFKERPNVKKVLKSD